MATPYKTEREFMGIGTQPYDSYFQMPAEKDWNQFAPESKRVLEANDMFRREQDAARRSRQTQDNANTLVDNLPYLTDKQVDEAILRDPTIQQTPQIETIDGFLARRQRFSQPKPQSDEVIGPRILEKIQNPEDREMFKRRVLQEGYSVEQAQDLYYNDDYNRKQETRLAEAGVSPAEFDALKVNGRYDMAKVGQRMYQAVQDKERAKYDLRGNTAAARQLENATNILKARARILESQGEDPAKDPLYNRAMQDMERAYDLHMRELNGEVILPEVANVSGAVNTSTADQVNPVAVVTPDQQVAQTTQVQQNFAREAFEKGLTPEQAEAEFQQRTQEAPVKAEIDQAWTDAKLGLGSRLLKRFPNEDRPSGNPAELLARAIITGADAPGDTSSMRGSLSEWETGSPDRIPYSDKALRDIGVDPYAVIFEEPGNERTGSQAVKANEILQAWARDFLTAKGLLNAQAPVTQEETEADRIAKKYIK